MELTEAQKDILKEVGNIGIGHAATALSKITKNEVDIDLPDLQVSNQTELSKTYPLGGYFMNCSIKGELNGNLAFVMAHEEAFRLIEIMVHAQIGSIKEINEMGKSALQEMVNILSGAYLTSLSDFCNFNLMPNPPMFFSNLKKEDLDGVLGTGNEILEVKTNFKVSSANITSRMWLVLEKESMEQILSRLE